MPGRRECVRLGVMLLKCVDFGSVVSGARLKNLWRAVLFYFSLFRYTTHYALRLRGTVVEKYLVARDTRRLTHASQLVVECLRAR